MHKRAIRLALGDGAGGALPTEFRLFVAGVNETENGTFLFDNEAAASVMAEYEAWGVDLMIDLEHQSLEVEPGAPDPTARDARGWCRLELRNGELWAVDVRWTPDGAARLQNKTQRYVSPAFNADPKTGRVMQMINVAIVAMPATHNTPALVAASYRKGLGMEPKVVKDALDALEKGDHEAAKEILKSMIASAASNGEGDADGSADRGAEGTAPPKTEAADTVEPVVKNDAADGDGADDKDEKKKLALMVKSAVAEALAAERTKRESTDRRQLVAELVKMGAEFPSTVFVDPLKKDGALKSRWAAMPLAELRSHVAEQRAARGQRQATPGMQPARGNADGSQAITLSNQRTVVLSAQELRYCEDAKCDPKDYAFMKAQRDGASE